MLKAPRIAQAPGVDNEGGGAPAAAREADREASYYEQLFHANEDAMFVSQLESQAIVDVNDTACRWLGYARDELLGRRLEDLCVGNSARAFDAMHEELHRAEAAWMIATITDRDGKERPVRLDARRLGEALFRSSLRDLSEREGRAVLHRPVDSLTREAIGIARVGGWQMDLRTMTPTLSEEVERIYEVERGDMLTLEQSLRFYPPEVRPMIERAVGEAIAQGTMYDLELPFTTHKGRRIWIRTLGKCEVVDGAPVRLYGAFQDITQRKRSELQQRAIERMRACTYELRPGDDVRALLNAASVGLSELRVPHQRAVFMTFEGMSPKRAYECAEGQAWADAEVEAPLAAALLEALGSERELCAIDLNEQTGLRYAWLTRRPEVRSIAATRRPSGVLCVASDQSADYTPADLSFLGALADELERGKARLRELDASAARDARLLQAQKLEAIGRLAGGVAHDFNNALTVILGVCDLIERELMLGPPRGSLLSDIRVIAYAGEQAAQFTQQLLAFSRRQTLQPKTLNLHTTLRASERVVQRLVGEDISLRMNFDAQSPLVTMDPGQLSQLLMNLAANARDAMPSGGTLTVTTRNLTSGAAWVVLSVVDSGHGIGAEFLPHIFEPFFTTKSVGLGTGLGLATVQSIVEQSGGRIEVESAPDQGTRFDIYLQRSEQAEDPMPQAAEPEIGGRERLMVIDDHALVRALSASILRDAGYDVLEASSTAEAQDHFIHRGARPQLIVSDVVMPGGTGAELFAWLRARDPSVRVLFMTGYAEAASEKHAVTASTVDVLQKPFRSRDLLRAVRQALDARPATPH